MINKKLYSFIINCVIFLLLAGCDATPSIPAVPTPAFVTATLPPTAIPAATQTLSPPTVVPTIAPIAGTTTTEVNVRVDTSTASESLGTIPAFSAIQIIGKDASGNWIQIIFNDGTGWVRADFVQAGDAAAEIPVVGAGSGVGVGTRGVVLSGVNVRSGPGRDFESLGLLNQNDVVSILGKDSSGAWMQIAYAAAPEGTGWVATEFLQIEDVEAIPLLNETPQTAEPDSVETPLSVLPAKTARVDGDTADAPLAFFDLSAAGVRSVQFKGEVSAPEGDVEDWLGFSSQSTDVVIQVLCESGAIQVELSESGSPNTLSLECGSAQVMQVHPGGVYRLWISLNPTGTVTYANYEIRIEISD